MSVWGDFVRWLTGTTDEEYVIQASASGSSDDAEALLDMRLLIMASAMGYLATGLAQSNWRTIDRGEETKGREWFRLNNRPNPNQNKSEFCAKLVWKLAMQNEAVVFSPNRRDLYIADSWSLEDNGVKESIYRDVTIDNSSYSRDFKASNVMHLRLNWTGVGPLLASVGNDYVKMINTAYSGYQKQTGTKGIVNVGAVAAGTPEQKEAALNRVQAKFKQFFNATSGVAVLTAGQTYTPIASSNRNTSEINDVANLTDEFAERVGLALRVSSALLKGNSENTENAKTATICDGIAPIARQFEQEYAAKWLGESDVLAGSRLYIDTTPLLLSDASIMANFCERMTSCGQHSVDELRELRGEPRLNTEEAQIHYITKNYGELGNEEA